MKIQINNPWIEELLKQHFLDLEISKDTEIIITNHEKFINIELKSTKQNIELNKPISIISLISIITQAKQTFNENFIIIGPIKFYPQLRICNFEGQEIRLTLKESEVLLLLFKQFPNYVSKTKLLESVWGYSEEITTHTLETHIYKLRNKFADKYDIIYSNEEGYLLNL